MLKLLLIVNVLSVLLGLILLAIPSLYEKSDNPDFACFKLAWKTCPLIKHNYYIFGGLVLVLSAVSLVMLLLTKWQ